MRTALIIELNGQQRTIPELSSPTDLASLIAALKLKSDRIAVEHNGEIVSRATWTQERVANGDRL